MDRTKRISLPKLNQPAVMSKQETRRTSIKSKHSPLIQSGLGSPGLTN